jgi:hypothetical protein
VIIVTSVQKYSNIVISREGVLDYAVIHLLDVSPAMNYTIMLNMYICAYICVYIVLVGICSWARFCSSSTSGSRLFGFNRTFVFVS